jgi:ABC-2 type transport system permease protein
MRRLKPLVEKEIKDLLRDPRIYVGLLVPVFMMPLLGIAMSMAMRSTSEAAAGGIRVALLDLDVTQASTGLASILSETGLRVSPISGVGDAVKEADLQGAMALIVIPKGFGESLLCFNKAPLEIYSIVRSTGLGSVGVYSALDDALNVCSEALSNTLIARLSSEIRPDVLREPLSVVRYTVVKDRVLPIPAQVFFGQTLMGASIMVPMVMLILAITVAQIAATATAVENEEKTLETLLTFPVTRYEILLAKLLGSSIVAILGGGIFTLSFTLYYRILFAMPMFEAGLGGTPQALPPPPLEAYVVLALGLVLSILFTTSLGVVLGALSSDVRVSSSLLGVIIVPVLVPSLLIMYGDVGSLPMALRLVTYALPTSYPMLTAKEVVLSNLPAESIYGIPYSAALTVAAIYATSRLLLPEKLLSLQHMLRLRRGKPRLVGAE